jgi:hypothetical protein
MSYDTMEIGILIIILDIIFGFIAYGTSVDHYSDSLIPRNQYQIIKNNDGALFFKADGQQVYTKNYKICTHLEQIKFFKRTNFNHYDGETYEYIVVFNDGSKNPQ